MAEYEPVSRALVDNLLTLARAFAKARKIKLRSLSRMAHGDPPMLENLARGKGSLTLRKYDSSMEWLHKNWPDGEPIPVLPVNVILSHAKVGA